MTNTKRAGGRPDKRIAVVHGRRQCGHDDGRTTDSGDAVETTMQQQQQQQQQDEMDGALLGLQRTPWMPLNPPHWTPTAGLRP